MRRETQNVMLLLLGGALLKIALTGTYLRYVKPAQLPWLVGAGVIVVLLAGTAIMRDIRATTPDECPHGTPRNAESGVHARNPSSPWMLLLPVLAIFLVTPPALGSDSVKRAADRVGVQRPSSTRWFSPLPSGPAPLLRISEFVTRAMWDDTGSLNGRVVRLQGFVVHPTNPARPGEALLARMRITCCAADASPVRVELVGREGAQAAALPADTWLEVTGTLRPTRSPRQLGAPVNSQIPTLDVTSSHAIPAPQDPYEY